MSAINRCYAHYYGHRHYLNRIRKMILIRVDFDLSFEDYLPYISKLFIQLAVYFLIGLSRLRSATFEHLLRLGASFCGSNNLEQFVPFLSNFSEQGRFRAHIKHEKANDFIENFKSFMV